MFWPVSIHLHPLPVQLHLLHPRTRTAYPRDKPAEGGSYILLEIKRLTHSPLTGRPKKTGNEPTTFGTVYERDGAASFLYL